MERKHAIVPTSLQLNIRTPWSHDCVLTYISKDCVIFFKASPLLQKKVDYAKLGYCSTEAARIRENTSKAKLPPSFESFFQKL